VLLQQFSNPANPQIHHGHHRREIWDDTEGTVDVLVAGVAPAARSTGVSRLHPRPPWASPWLSVAVEPEKQPGDQPSPCRGSHWCLGPTKSRGSAPVSYPITSTFSLVDRVEAVSNEEAVEMARRLMREEGILAGISCGGGHGGGPSPGRRSGLRRPNDRLWCCPIPASAISSSVLFEGVFDSARPWRWCDCRSGQQMRGSCSPWPSVNRRSTP